MTPLGILNALKPPQGELPKWLGRVKIGIETGGDLMSEHKCPECGANLKLDDFPADVIPGASPMDFRMGTFADDMQPVPFYACTNPSCEFLATVSSVENQ
jgi:hypothetical protein